MQRLPIDSLLERIQRVLQVPGATLLLQAPPGAGKTTRVPGAALAALQRAQDTAGGVWMVEPRRLAARAAAERLAQERGEAVGQQVGYSVRLERRVSAATRIEVLTGGLFLRRLQADPGLSGVGCLILDEFHERHADTDLALALVRQARDLLTPELRLVVMSATLELEALAAQLPEATVLRSEGRSHPVAVEHQPPRPAERLEQQVVRALETHWLGDGEPQDTTLVFLPGQREIQGCARAIGATSWAGSVDWVGLHGNLPLAQQSQAIAPARPGRGKVVLATSIAESSLTIAGVRLVIDAGLSRRNRFDPASGMDGLVTVPASLASADQRAGRAGRLGPGTCVRLWSPADQRRRPAHDTPALQEADPLPLALQLAWWGDPLGEQLAWLDPPRPAALAEARQLLAQLEALDATGTLTAHGRRLAELGLPPRLGHMLLVAKRWGAEDLASELAVLLSERDPLERSEAGGDLLARLDWLRRQPAGHPLRRLQAQWLQRSGERERGPARAVTGPGSDSDWAARLVASAYPERVALARREGRGRYLMRNGRGAVLHPDDPLLGAEALAIASADGGDQNARIQLAVAMEREQLRRLAEEHGCRRAEARWDADAARVRCEQRLQLDALVLETRPWPDAGGAAVIAALLEGLRQKGIGALPWTPPVRQLQHRLQLAHRHLGPPWPDRSDSHLASELDAWLGPHLEGCRSLEDVGKLNLSEALWQGLDWTLRLELERLLPERLPVPTGRLVRIDYSTGEPVLAVKLQELFGAAQGPAVLNGRLPVTLHLLTPAGRPAAITQDLAGFWAGSYREVRRELRGRYPKHPWPEDAANASPTALTHARQGQRSARLRSVRMQG
ncbi:ATP-dependent helicase HrpB [Cyanobium sp. NIES-981]|uniref:ATP-dependent helicase HrpB n=1 Tax=Cyanobium sp. NIES-981 TaxID=1851505 RepID=UPI0007DD320D|nr:ATP-dependent helicase HrpB [Cyanobium sp. NIES-981]SBO44773.1 ATP-dependent helicase HrpB [Cyanobium sp. NIES-981]